MPLYTLHSALHCQPALACGQGWCQKNMQSRHTSIKHCMLCPQSQSAHFNKGTSSGPMVQAP